MPQRLSAGAHAEPEALQFFDHSQALALRHLARSDTSPVTRLKKRAIGVLFQAELLTGDV